jgi:hypothetical protein
MITTNWSSSVRHASMRVDIADEEQMRVVQELQFLSQRVIVNGILQRKKSKSNQ